MRVILTRILFMRELSAPRRESRYHGGNMPSCPNRTLLKCAAWHFLSRPGGEQQIANQPVLTYRCHNQAITMAVLLCVKVHSLFRTQIVEPQRLFFVSQGDIAPEALLGRVRLENGQCYARGQFCGRVFDDFKGHLLAM